MKKQIAVLTSLLLIFGMVFPGRAVWAATTGVTITDVKASIDLDQLVTVTGRISSGAGTHVTIAVMDPEGQQEYLNTVASGDGGSFTFAYTLNNGMPGKYNVTLGAAGLDRLAETSFYYGSNAGLKSLSTSLPRLDSEFSPDKTSYTATVDSRIETCTVTPAAYDSAAKITVNGSVVPNRSDSDEIRLITGENTVKIVVTAPDSTQKTYSIVITRREEVITSIEASAKLDSNRLVTVSGSLSSGSAQRVSVKILDPQNDVEYVNSTTTTADGKFELQYGLINPRAGRYSVIVGAVGARLPLKTCYFDYGTDAELTTLYLNGINLSQPFLYDVKDYAAEVGKGLSVTNVTAVARDQAVKMSVNGIELKSGKQSEPIKLNEGPNKISITVTAQDGVTQKIYNVEVTKDSNADVHAAVHAKIDKNKIVSISGILNGTNSRKVSVVVKNPNGEIDYLNSTTVSEAMGFTFEYLMTGKVYGKYNVTIGTQGLAAVVSTYFIYNPQSADLKNLALDKASLKENFVPDKTVYQAQVGESTDSVSIVPTAEAEGAKIMVNGSVVKSGETSGPIVLNYGTNTINIVVISEDESTQKTYTIYIERIVQVSPVRVPLSSDASLSSLAISAGTLEPVFNPATTDYDLTVENSLSSITVTPTVNESHALVKVNGTALASGSTSSEIVLATGSNKVTVEVTAQDGVTKKEYNITINKGTGLSDANLGSLTVFTGGETGEERFPLDEDIMVYEISIPDSLESIGIIPRAEDSNATVIINDTTYIGPEAMYFKISELVENKITIEVIAQDGTINTYTVRLCKLSSDASLSGLAVFIGGEQVEGLVPDFSSDTTLV